jgi:hypothetical protein
MSRLWDTPEFWARNEADELLRDFPNTSVAALAASFEKSHPACESDPDFIRDIARELLRRVAEGVRFWPEVPGIVAVEREFCALMMGADALAAPRDGDCPEYWWQRI